MDLLNLSNKMIWSGPKWSFFRELHSLPKSPVLCTHTEEHINKLISHKNSVYSIYSWAFTMCAHLTEKWTQKHNTDINPDFIITRITSVKDDVTKSSPNLTGLTVVTLILFLMIKYFCLIIMIRATCWLLDFAWVCPAGRQSSKVQHPVMFFFFLSLSHPIRSPSDRNASSPWAIRSVRVLSKATIWSTFSCSTGESDLFSNRFELKPFLSFPPKSLKLFIFSETCCKSAPRSMWNVSI